MPLAEADLGGLIDRIGARLGPATRQPHRRATKATCRSRRKFFVRPICRRAARLAALPGGQPLDRPFRLFARPEPVDAIAEVPDGPPVHFRWRRALYRVARAEGPERIAAEWWRDDDALTRDYFRVEDTRGRRFWLYREGLYGREITTPRWYMHGVFA